MAKTVALGEIEIPHIGTFVANALPDPFDERDLDYRPRLEPLPPTLDQRTGLSRRFVMEQVGSSCTGHALATPPMRPGPPGLAYPRPPLRPDARAPPSRPAASSPRRRRPTSGAWPTMS